MSETTQKESTMQQRWRTLMDAKLANIKTLKQLMAEDQNVDEIVQALRELYRHKIDTVPLLILSTLGAKIIGNKLSVATTTSIKRAERDASEQSYEELLSSVTLMNKIGEVGVTEARAIAKEQLGEFATEILWREQHKNSYEAVVNSADTIVSFIQSIIKIRLSERTGTRLMEEGA